MWAGLVGLTLAVDLCLRQLGRGPAAIHPPADVGQEASEPGFHSLETLTILAWTVLLETG